MPDTPSLIFLPGLGGDARQFEPQRAAFPDLCVPAWIPPRRGEPLRAYAERLASHEGIPPGSVVAGSSFGGMIALEIGRAVGARAVVLVGSCRTPRAVAPGLRIAARLSRPVPAAMIDALRPAASPLSRLVGPMTAEHRRLLLDMAKATPAPFLKWAGTAVAAWPGCEDPGVPVHHIHGGQDRIIPVGRVRADAVIAGAGHAPNLTHAAEVNEFLRSAMNSGAGRSTA